jgi:phycocyanobilin:ferredoxin oxidoreductase
MSDIWHQLITIQDEFIERFNNSGEEIYEEGMARFNRPGWINRVWSGNKYRRAHIDVVDVRDTKGIWMMHCCVFPHTDNTAPIFGYDVIAGKNKITGFFHDFSSTGYPHPLMDWFGEEVGKIEWRKTRELPDWAKRIFSKHMIAAGNVNQQDELDQILSMATRNLDQYLNTIDETAGHCVDNTKAQNFYCDNQKLNPHNPKVMTSVGLDEEEVRIFIEECLFPNIR